MDKKQKMLITLAKRLKTLRNNNNLSQQELGNKINISGTMIGYIETAKKPPSIYTLKRISYYFNVTTDYLLGLSDENKYKKEKNIL